MPQGGPFSAARFALALRRAIYEFRGRGAKNDTLIQLILSCLDDLTLAATPAHLAQMAPVVTEELQNVGHSLNMDKPRPGPS